MATTVRCPECQRKNRIPEGAAGKARCGACRALLMPPGGGATGPTTPVAFGGPSDVAGPPAFFGAPGAGAPWGPGGPPGPGSPSLPGGPGGPGPPWGGGGGAGDATGARMRQTRRTTRKASTRGSGPRPSGFGPGAARPGDPRALLVQRWDELLRLAPPDMGLTAALGQGGQNPAGDPLAWLSAAAGVPREELDEVRQLRNGLASNRAVPDEVIAGALETVERALAVVGRTRLPE